MDTELQKVVELYDALRALNDDVTSLVTHVGMRIPEVRISVKRHEGPVTPAELVAEARAVTEECARMIREARRTKVADLTDAGRELFFVRLDAARQAMAELPTHS